MKMLKKMFKLLAISAIFILGIVHSIAAADISSEAPSGIPLSELEQFIDDFAAKHIGNGTAGASVSVIKNGEIIINKAYGYAIQGEAETDPNSVFEWGSATKLLVWTSAMQLEEQGKLNLNNDIREYLPQNFLKKIKYETPITMYNLMHHNAGWEDRVVDLFYSSPCCVPNLEEALLSWEPAQIFQPGTIVAYSNFGVGLAGFIVERLSGLPFHQYVRENIFEPLGMRNTAIHPLQADNLSVAERRGQIKGHISANGILIPAPNERIFIGMYPAGSAIGTTLDAVKFLSALMPDNETSVLFNNSETLNKMLQVSLSFRDGFPRFSHGFMEHYGAVRALGHGGNTAAFSTLFTFAPEERFGVAVMANQAQETALCYGLTKALFGEFTPPEDKSTFADANELTGFYTMARKPTSGFTSFIMSMVLLPFNATDENTLVLGGAVLKQISPYVFKNTGGFELLDIVDYIFFDVQNDRVSVMYFDLLPIKTGELILNISSAILFALCVLYILPAIFILIIGAVRNKKKRIPSNLIKKLNLALILSITAVIINNTILAVRTLNFSVYASLLVHFIFNIAFIIFVPICVVFMRVNRKKEPSKASRVFNMFSMISSIILAAFLIVWEFWR